MKLGIKHLIVLLVAIFSIISYTSAVCLNYPCSSYNDPVCSIVDYCGMFINLLLLHNIKTIHNNN